VIYHLKDGRYPFHPAKEGETAFLEYVKTVDSPSQMNHYKNTTKLFRSIQCPYLMQISRILREDNSIHFLF